MTLLPAESEVEPAPRTAPVRDEPVLVGVDGSAAGDAALLWAAREAASRGTMLTVVNAWAWAPLTPWTARIDTDIVSDLRAESARVLEDARAAAVEYAPVNAEAESLEGAPGDVLIEAAANASLIVVGHHDLPAVARALHCSTGATLAAHAAQTVVVVRETPLGGAGTVVIAIAADRDDGRLLSFGFDYARRHQLAVKVVTCWHVPAISHSKVVPHEVHVCFSEYVSRWRDVYPDVQVTLAVRTDAAADALVEESAGAELLVVGRRGRSVYLGTLLGSVRRAMLHRAQCTVAVVPPSPDRDPASPGHG